MIQLLPFNSANTSFSLDLPDWAVAELNRLPPALPTLEARMATVINFSRLNFEQQTGGPFAAGVFERQSGKLVIIGVNRVMPFNCSSAHAEIMAISLAQKLLGVYDLGAPGLPAYQIVVNWRPCAMCLGAVLWSGVRSLAIAGDGQQLEAMTGFDEGPVHPNWQEELESRGIEVVKDVLIEEAIAVFRAFAESEAFVYNPRLGAE